MTAHQRIGRTLPNWPADLPCTDRLPLFYPEAAQGRPSSDSTEHPAKRLCKGVPGVMDACPIRKWCGEYAISTKDAFGIWGGMTGKERRMERKHRRDAGEPEFVSFETIVVNIEIITAETQGENAA